MKVEMGYVYATRGALDSGRPLTELLLRHWQGDWGDLDEEDKLANDRALKSGGRLLSAYGPTTDEPPDAPKLWIITEAAG